jgi:SAM-dependent methyltransferase
MNPAEFDFIAASEEKFWWYRGMRQIMFALIDPLLAKLPPGILALEAGCGTGHFSKVLAERYGWRMIPADLGAEGLVYGQAMGLENLLQCDVGVLPLASNSLDAVVCMDVLVHFPRGEEQKAIAEFARTLKPGGHLLLRVSALDILRSHHSIHATERQRFTRTRLIETVTNLGFTVDWCSYANTFLLPVALVKFRIIEPLSGQSPSSGVQPVSNWLDKILFSALSAEARWFTRKGRFPLGQSLVLIARKLS